MLKKSSFIAAVGRPPTPIGDKYFSYGSSQIRLSRGATVSFVIDSLTLRPTIPLVTSGTVATIEVQPSESQTDRTGIPADRTGILADRTEITTDRTIPTDQICSPTNRPTNNLFRGKNMYKYYSEGFQSLCCHSK